MSNRDESEENAELFADFIAVYYKRLVGKGIPEEVAKELVVNFQTGQMYIAFEKANELSSQDDLLKSFMKSFSRGDRN